LDSERAQETQNLSGLSGARHEPGKSKAVSFCHAVTNGNSIFLQTAYSKYAGTVCSETNAYVVEIKIIGTIHETKSRPPDVEAGNTSATSVQNIAPFVHLR
jgi:hypothetical protein